MNSEKLKTKSLSAAGRFARIVLYFSLFTFSFSLVSVTAQTDGEPEDAVAVFNSAQDLHEKGDLTGAIKLYEKALKIVPEFPEAVYQCGVAQLTLGQNAEAEKSFRRAVELKADWTMALTSLGSLLVQNDKFAEAERLLSKAIELDPQNASALDAMTGLRLRTKASPAVLTDLLVKVTVLTSKANPTASIWTAKAGLEIALGTVGSAKSSLANALKIDPKDLTALFQVAQLAIDDGDIVQAKVVAKKLENAGPKSDSLSYLNAEIAAAEGNFDEALKLLDTIPATSISSNELRADITARRTTNPIELEKQLEVAPKNPVILGRLCSLYRIPDPAKALGYCRRASEAEPDNVTPAVGYGAALVQAKQFDAAVNVLRKILEIAPDNSTAHANLATALFELKRYREAKAEYDWLTNKQPDLAAAWYFLAITHDRLGEYMDALANYQQYLRIADPVANKLDIEKVNLRLPTLQRQIKDGKGKRSEK